MARTGCFGELADAIVAGRLSGRAALAKDPQPVLDALFPLLAYPSLLLPRPLFVGTGEADRDVPPAMQGALVRDACAAGTRVVWRRYPGLDHSATVNASLADGLPFARSVPAGREVASGCPDVAGAGDAARR